MRNPKYTTTKIVDDPVEEAYNKWILTITLWPRTCVISGKTINMMTKAYVNKGQFGLFNERWARVDELVLARLKGEI